MRAVHHCTTGNGGVQSLKKILGVEDICGKHLASCSALPLAGMPKLNFQPHPVWIARYATASSLETPPESVARLEFV